MHSGTTCLCILRHDFRVLGIPLCVDEVVLGIANAALYARGFVHFVIQTEPLDDVLDQCPAVLGVIDGEISQVIDAFALHAKNPSEDAVKGSHPNVPCFTFPDDLRNPALHLPCRLVRER